MKTVLRAHSRKGAPGCLGQEDLARRGGSSYHLVVSGLNASSCDVNGFDHLGQAHNIPDCEDCAFHSEWLWFWC